MKNLLFITWTCFRNVQTDYILNIDKYVPEFQKVEVCFLSGHTVVTYVTMVTHRQGIARYLIMWLLILFKSFTDMKYSLHVLRHKDQNIFHLVQAVCIALYVYDVS